MKARFGISRGRDLLTAVLLTGGLSCAPKAPLPPFEGEAADRIRALGEARVTMRSLRAETRVEIRGGGRRFRFRADLLAERPGRLYAEASGLGLTAAAVAVDEGKALVFLPSRGEAYRGDSAEILGKLLGISLPAEEWVGLLLGDLPPHGDPILDVKERGDSTVVTLGQGKARVILEFHRGSSWLKSFRELGPRRRTLVFGAPMSTPAGPIPSELRVDLAGSGSVSVRFVRVVPNPSFPPGSFGIALPAGVEPRPLKGAEVLIPE